MTNLIIFPVTIHGWRDTLQYITKRKISWLFLNYGESCFAFLRQLRGPNSREIKPGGSMRRRIVKNQNYCTLENTLKANEPIGNDYDAGQVGWKKSGQQCMKWREGSHRKECTYKIFVHQQKTGWTAFIIEVTRNQL